MTLYIDTKETQAVTVAIKKNGKIIDSLTDYNEYGSEALLPLINKLLKKNHRGFQDLRAVEVETGPGSFTGLRVGACVAQALGFSLGIPVNKQIGKPVEISYT